MGMIVAVFKQAGTVAWCSDQLKMAVNTAASWLAHTVRALPGTPSGPGAFLVLMLHRTHCT